jgi:hypothetical protein
MNGKGGLDQLTACGHSILVGRVKIELEFGNRHVNVHTRLGPHPER